MCCWTHGYRDNLVQRQGEQLTLVAADDPFRCQCGFGQLCQRRATEEDQQCDWCRGTNHQEFCDAIPGSMPDALGYYQGSYYREEPSPYVIEASPLQRRFPGVLW